MLRKTKNRAFTLIELLVVIAILALLVGIILPTMNNARQIAKKAASQAFINTLDGALESYKLDSVFGGSYPPSFVDTGATGNPYDADGFPNGSIPGGMKGTNFKADGAQCLVWALQGADGQGCPGMMGNLKDLYECNSAGKPLRRRAAPFVQVGKGSIAMAQDTGFSKFNPGQQGQVPVYIDAFGGPILYFRYMQKISTGGTADSHYDARDNQHMVKGKGLDLSDQGTLDKYTSEDEQGGAAKVNVKRFILISPGADGVFGSEDGKQVRDADCSNIKD